MLDVLAGRKDPKCITGTLLIDGHQMPKNFKCLSGYVVQVGCIQFHCVSEEIVFFLHILTNIAINIIEDLS